MEHETHAFCDLFVQTSFQPALGNGGSLLAGGLGDVPPTGAAAGDPAALVSLIEMETEGSLGKASTGLLRGHTSFLASLVA